ncbi:YaiI/YqxD family protein [Salinicoccus sp. ID82-1]|uniref:YaiI/YqxD family protein n=1 Tax=Salinicoccus sp. ID82-1 TaxID=2820269 RepID=UPI001F206B3C|nr:YaiI/YqxD family protein [Salinicoccus sp. ID82-1]MCG1010370.1 YaiI/YqxD family protein [Salinicoccus sp. ID82-1]
MKIIVDADACPVKDIVMEEAARASVPVTLVSSLSHYSSKDLPAHVEAVYVEAGPDAADFRIVQLAKKGDIVVTQDYGLASLLLPKGCIVLHHKGFEYNDLNIDNLLATRHMGSMIRKGGGRTKGPKPFSKEDRAAFLTLLRKKLELK